MTERDVKFFRPLWIRLLLTAVCVAWFAAETIFGHDQLWMGVTGVAVGWCVWNLFLRFPKAGPVAAPADPAPKP